MTALHTSYGMIQNKLSEAEIRYETITDVKYTNTKEHYVIRCIKIYCNKIVQDIRLAEIEKALEKYLDEIVISSDQNTLYIKIR